MPGTIKTPNETPYCQATLNYSNALGIVPRDVSIHNGRAAELQWQQQGFELLGHTSAVSDWDDEVALESHYYQEMAELAKKLTGCHAAIIAGHIARNPDTAKQHGDYAPIQFAHSDFTENYEQLLKQRFALGHALESQALERAGITADDFAHAKDILILQFWRNVGDPRPDLPLAFCDAQTVARENLQSFHVQSYADGDFPFDTFALTTGVETHRWFTFPALTDREVVAFRTFDSRCAANSTPFWTPHSAFADPTVGNQAPARRSIEIRVTCLL